MDGGYKITHEMVCTGCRECKHTPDPAEVRRALESTERLYAALNCDEGTLWRSAREWLRLREQPAPDVRPKWCNVHQHHKWCEHNGGVMGPTGYAAPDEQAQERWDAIIREREALAEEVRQMVAAVEQMPDVQAQIDAAVARERELGDARVVAARADERNEMAELAYAALRDAGMHAGEAFRVSRQLIHARSTKRES